ncbi:MAG: hypothetical protein ACOX5F_06785 [Anaerovoracaceae bacterium]|jgi:hypothetical protein
MKKLIPALIVAIMVVALIPTSAFAAEIVYIEGYNSTKDSSQFSISNVVEADSKSYIPGVPTYVCHSPATVVSTTDLAWFAVASLVQQGDRWIESEMMEGEGKGLAFNYDTLESEVVSYEESLNSGDEPYIFKGAKVTLTTPGVYYALGRYAAIAGEAEAVIVVKDDTTVEDTTIDDTTVDGAKDDESKPEPTKTITPRTVTAAPTPSTVLVDGGEVAFESYNIDGYNYFKLRDIAVALHTSDKKFEVGWDASKKAINLIAGQSYTVAGGELELGDGKAKKATTNMSDIYKDGKLIYLESYTIGGYNYFKLRDLGEAFDFNVAWDAENKTVVIDSLNAYTGE